MQQIRENKNVRPEDVSSGHWTMAALAAVFAIAALTASVGAIHARLYGHDIFFLLDNGWRALHGQRVHVDYVSAWGPLTFLMIAAGLAISGGSVAAITYAGVIFGAIAGAWSVWLGAARSRTVLALLCPCFVVLIAAAPFALGDPPEFTSQAMVYNRYGYVLLTLLMMECFLPTAGIATNLRHKWLEPALTGCVLGLVLFLKITYFLIALPLLGMSLLFRIDRGSRLVGHGVGFGITALAFLTYLHFNVAAMLADLQTAAGARSGTLGIGRNSAELLMEGALRVVLLVASTYLCRRWIGPTADRRLLWRGWFYPLTAVVVVAADTMLLLTNAQVVSYPLTAAYSLILLLSIAPTLISKNFQLLAVTAVLLALPLMLAQCVGIGQALIESKTNTNPPGLLRFESPRLHPLVLYDIGPDNMDYFSNGREYVSSVNEGIRLINAHSAPTDKVTTLDMANPFPFALGREPVQGGLAAAAYGFTLNDLHHPSAARYFGDSTIVMVPKTPASPPVFYDGFRKIYEPALRSGFYLEAESAKWWLYRRNEPGTR